MNTTISRYMVSDEECGFLESFPSLAKAKAYASSIRAKYKYVTIFDRMAKKGAPQEWAWCKCAGRTDWFCTMARPLDPGDLRHFSGKS